MTSTNPDTSIQPRLREFAEKLGKLPTTVYHYQRAKKAYPCIVWQEDGTSSLHADGGTAEMSITGTLDYFTMTEFDPMVDRISAHLQSLGIPWGIESIQWEDDTGLWHYEWTWEV